MPRLRPNERTKTTVSIQFSRTYGGDESTPYHMTITDDASSLVVADIRMTGPMVAAMITGAGSDISAPAELVDAEGYCHVGKVSWLASILLENDFDSQGFERGAVRLRNLMETSALHRDLGADAWNVSTNRDGIGLSLYGYAASPAEAVDAAASSAALLWKAAEKGEWNVKSNRAHVHPSAASIQRDAERESRHR